MRWLRALIDGLACIASLGLFSRENRALMKQTDSDRIASDWHAAESEWEASNRELQRAINGNTPTVEHVRRHREDYDRYLDARVRPTCVTTARDTAYRGVAHRDGG